MGKPSGQDAPVSVVNTDAAVVRLSSILGIPVAEMLSALARQGGCFHSER